VSCLIEDLVFGCVHGCVGSASLYALK